MPANPKYLLPSNWQKFAKLSEALIGSLFVTASLHLVVAAYINPDIVFKTAQYSFFLIWVGLMFIPYIIKKAWHSWILFLLLTAAFTLLMWFKLPV